MLNKIAIFSIVFLLIMFLLMSTTVVQSLYAQNLNVNNKKHISTNKAEISSAVAAAAITKATTTSANTTSEQHEIKRNLVSNPDFLPSIYMPLFPSNPINFPANWNDSLNQCTDTFQCTINFTDGLRDNLTFQVSTASNNKNMWSWIRGEEINVKPKEQYTVITNMKLNTYAMQSHIVIEGFNQTSKVWYPIAQCPSGINGPREWKAYNCQITIPANMIKIRPVLNAGWSSQRNEEATTLFGHIEIKKL